MTATVYVYVSYQPSQGTGAAPRVHCPRRHRIPAAPRVHCPRRPWFPPRRRVDDVAEDSVLAAPRGSDVAGERNARMTAMRSCSGGRPSLIQLRHRAGNSLGGQLGALRSPATSDPRGAASRLSSATVVSSRDAVLTTSPRTVYSRRRGDPMSPAMHVLIDRPGYCPHDGAIESGEEAGRRCNSAWRSIGHCARRRHRIPAAPRVHRPRRRRQHGVAAGNHGRRAAGHSSCPGPLTTGSRRISRPGHSASSRCAGSGSQSKCSRWTPKMRVQFWGCTGVGATSNAGIHRLRLQHRLYRSRRSARWPPPDSRRWIGYRRTGPRLSLAGATCPFC